MHIPAIPGPSREIRRQAEEVYLSKTKPAGSLGRIEWLGSELAAIKRELPPRVENRTLLLFAADHGVASRGVSAYPQAVTREMLRNFARGGAAANVLSRLYKTNLTVIDVGVIGEPVPGTVNSKVREGTADFTIEPALSTTEAERAFQVGLDAAYAAQEFGAQLLLVGEMGIGNTSSASALLSLMSGMSPKDTVGLGTGCSPERLRHKLAVVEQAIARHHEVRGKPWQCLEAVGGLEICALVGACIGGAASSVPVIVDGFICTVAALIATAIAPDARPALLFAHRGSERGHRVALEFVSATPLLDIELSLGEGSGALLILPLVDAAVALMLEMATFASAGVSTKASDDTA